MYYHMNQRCVSIHMCMYFMVTFNGFYNGRGCPNPCLGFYNNFINLNMDLVIWAASSIIEAIESHHKVYITECMNFWKSTVE